MSFLQFEGIRKVNTVECLGFIQFNTERGCLALTDFWGNKINIFYK